MNQWEWGNEGVQVLPDRIIWYEKETEVRFASGAATEQTFANFLARGPLVSGVPLEIVKEVAAAVQARVATGTDR